MAIDLRERQFLAQLVALPAVAGEVDRLRVQERFVEPVELLLDRFDAALLFRRPLVRFRTPLLPGVEDAGSRSVLRTTEGRSYECLR